MIFRSRFLLLILGNWKQIFPPPYLPFCPSSILLLWLHSLLCALRNKTEDKQKFFAKWVGYLFPIALTLFISACSHVEEKRIVHQKHSPKALTLSIANKQLLKKEMLAIEKGMKTLLSSIATGDWQKTAEIGKQMQASYIMKQNLTPKQLKHLHQHLPAQFVKLDHSFHHFAGMLTHAAEHQNAEVVGFYFYKMTDSCVQCHSTYARNRFSGFSVDRGQDIHQH